MLKGELPYTRGLVMVPRGLYTASSLHDIVRHVLAPFDWGLQVPPYKDYMDAKSIAHFCKLFHINPDDNDAVLTEWLNSNQHGIDLPNPGDHGFCGYDERGLFVFSTINPVAQWHSWWLFGDPHEPVGTHDSCIIEMRRLLIPPLAPLDEDNMQFPVVLGEHGPMWLASHEPDGSPNPRFAPMLADIKKRYPEHYLIAIKFLAVKR